MIKKLKIQNLQSHAKTELNFSEGVNVIVGTSDSGKTAIIRALRWLVWNRPSGEAIRSTWGGQTAVELHAGGDVVITRSKDKADQYRMHGEGRDLEFKAFGTSVPEEIVQHLNISEVNLQNQLDAPFLLSDSPGEVAAYFNKVAHLNKIDEATSRINSQIRQLTSDISYKKAHIETLKKDLEKFDYLGKFEAEVSRIEEIEGRTTNMKDSVAHLSKTEQELESIDAKINECNIVIQDEEDVDTLIITLQKKREIENNIYRINEIIGVIEGIESDSAKMIKLSSAEKTADKITSNIDHRARLLLNSATLTALVDTYVDLEQKLLRTQEDALKLEKQFHDEMPDVCPLCEQPIKK